MKTGKLTVLAKGTSLALALMMAMSLSPSAVLAASSTVKIAGDSVITVSTGAGGMSAAQRAQVIQSNLDNALVATENPSPSSVKIVYVKGTPVVTVGGYHVATADAQAAKSAGVTPAILAHRWADRMRSALSDSTSINRYIAQLSSTAGGGSNFKKAKLVYVPAGMTMPIKLTTTVSSQAAKAGDPVQAELAEDINMGDSVIPAGSMIFGKVVDAKASSRMAKGGELSVKFTSLRTPDGSESQVKAHLVGGIEKFGATAADGSNTLKGETTSSKVKNAAVQGAIGAGAGTLAGIAIGAIAGQHGRAVGRGAWSGAAIGAGLGVANSLLLRKGKDVVMESGTQLKLQLDAPATVAVSSGGAI